MPWIPDTDFEEEVVNLQPHHDFIFGVLSEPQFSYPRPKAHTEYAAKKKLESKEQQKEYEATGKINAKLHVIQQVQRMANTKPIGEQPTVDDWENNKKIEQETIGMMRYCGMGVSVEQPLNEKVTIATFPVENTIKVVKNGRRKVALFFDENVFKLQEKERDTSSGFESCNNSEANEPINIKDDSLASDFEGDTSFNTSSSLLLNSFSTAEEYSDSFSSASSCKKTMPTHTNVERRQYDKLLEDTSLLSLNTSSSRSCNSSQKQICDTFETAEETSFWTPIFEDEDIFSKKENWPALCKKSSACDITTSDNDDVLNKTQSSTGDVSSEASSCNRINRISFLARFIKSEDVDTIESTANSSSTTASEKSTTYAAIAKTPKVKPQASPKRKEKKDISSNVITDFPPYYTTRRMYALKRNVK